MGAFVFCCVFCKSKDSLDFKMGMLVCLKCKKILEKIPDEELTDELAERHLFNFAEEE